MTMCSAKDGGTLFHLVEWLAAIEKCYGHANESILARDADDQVVGVLPLMAGAKCPVR